MTDFLISVFIFLTVFLITSPILLMIRDSISPDPLKEVKARVVKQDFMYILYKLNLNHDISSLPANILLKLELEYRDKTKVEASTK